MGSRIDWTTDMLGALPSTRGDAFAENSRYFFTGRPCAKGHLTARVAASGKCLICSRIARKKNVKLKRDSQKQGNYVWRPANERHGLGSSVEMRLWASAKTRARISGITFSIKVTDVIIPDKCPIFGYLLDKRWGGRKQNNAARSNAPSLDRIDPRNGYVPGNIAVISYRANMIKGDGMPVEHRKIASYIRRQSRANIALPSSPT